MESLMQTKVDAYLTYLAKDEERSPNTTAAYRNDLNQFTKYVKNRCGDMPLPILTWQTVDCDVVNGYLLWMKQNGFASATIARKVAAIKSFFHWLETNDTLLYNPAHGLIAPRVKREMPHPIRPTEIEQLLAAPAREHSPRAMRDHALLQTLYASGMRVTELVNLNLADVDLARGTITCGALERSRRTIRLGPDALDALRCYVTTARALMQPHPDDEALFLNHRGQRLTRQGLWLIIRRYVKQVGIEAPVTPHTLRQSFAAHQLNAGRDLHEVKAMLGHASTQTTQAYRRAADELAGHTATITIDGEKYEQGDGADEWND